MPALLTVLAATAGCSGDGDGDDATLPAATSTPTAPGDRPLVEVLDAGSDERRVLSLTPDEATTSATASIAQQVVRDEAPAAALPPITFPFETTTEVADDGVVTATRTYAEPTVDPAQATAADERDLLPVLRELAGATSTLVVRPDGTTVEASSGSDTLEQIDAQLRDLVPVLPTEAVGPGARWTATSVAEVDAAVVDQVATYTLTSLEGDAYVVEVSIEQTYRRGEVEGVEVRSGRGTVTARLEGTLGELLPDTATGNVATEISYVVQQQVTQVRTTVALELTDA
ncbi:MAG: hypothetical protein JWN84_123 [Nocardioides sp.]|nr:hypothetical protein [Nocardioides sp.]